ncbi:uncharacterized protein LOC100890091 [Strongylocentrotus purpuratus]|uniref:Uncharacterized protein n=1 Tax=Strongylocentrotus purpuratus TaxID=7668 RepID=A0A7M7GEB1_STRPU|nr:uncharacterized protein LOC100890091 [Strongylocentrotus purpuratus]|eukprot:XP_003723362.1 PREDICTED: uncharacterized protein LOC100890091 [Strongylocentrotus purpuratus]
MYPSLSGHRQHRSGAGCSWRIHPLHLSSTTTMFLVLLLTCLLLQCGSGSASAQEIRSPGGKPHKFMRWGKRFLDTQALNAKPTPVESGSDELPNELMIPVIGTDRILCKHIAAGGLYKCISYRTPKSDSVYDMEQ